MSFRRMLVALLVFAVLLAACSPAATGSGTGKLFRIAVVMPSATTAVTPARGLTRPLHASIILQQSCCHHSVRRGLPP